MHSYFNLLLVWVWKYILYRANLIFKVTCSENTACLLIFILAIFHFHTSVQFFWVFSEIRTNKDVFSIYLLNELSSKDRLWQKSPSFPLLVIPFNTFSSLPANSLWYLPYWSISTVIPSWYPLPQFWSHTCSSQDILIHSHNLCQPSHNILFHSFTCWTSHFFAAAAAPMSDFS